MQVVSGGFSMTKRILAISNHASFLGGGEHSFLGLISRLPEDYRAIAAVPCEGELAKKTSAAGIATEIVPLAPLNPLSSAGVIQSTLKFVKICRNRNIDLIYANGSRAAFYGGLVGHLCSIPAVWHCRVIDSDPYLDAIITRLCRHIVVNSRATSLRFSRRLRDKIDIVHNGLDLKWLREEGIAGPEMINAGWISILMVSRVSRWKRHDVLLEAFERTAGMEKDAHLICVGGKDPSDPDWWNELQKRTALSPFTERIHWIGHVEDVRPWYRAAAVMVLPSNREPFGRVVVEAMASGLPVIATRSGGVPEIVTHMRNGILVPENDPDAVARALMDLIRNKALWNLISREAEQAANFFGIESHVEKMVRIFRRVSDDQGRDY